MTKRRVKKLIKKSFKSVLILTFAGMMIMMAAAKSASNLTISMDSSMYGRGIGISESALSNEQPQNEREANLRTVLRADPVENAWNIDGDRDIPSDAHLVDGGNNGEYYLVYSFHVYNGGEDPVNLLFTINQTRVTRNLDETIRVRLIIDRGDPETEPETVTYAKRNSEGGLEPLTYDYENEETVQYTEPFQSNGSIINTIGSLAPESQVRISIIVWIEGNDPDTTNDKIGGTISLEGILKIIE